jgi:hypothetical protein
MSLDLINHPITESVQTVIKSSPPMVVTGLTLYGTPISDIGIACTIIYTVLLIIGQIRKLITYKG